MKLVTMLALAAFASSVHAKVPEPEMSNDHGSLPVAPAAATITGSVGPETYDRIFTSNVDINCNATSTLSASGVGVPYAAIEFHTQSATGENLVATINAAGTTLADSVLSAYCDFDPADATTGLVAYDDDGGDGLLSAIVDADGAFIMPGRTYTLVVSVFSPDTVGGGVYQLDLGGQLALGPADADLAITKNAVPASPLIVGSTVNYALAVTNNGPGNADGVVVSDTLAANLTYVSDDCALVVAGQSLTWNIGMLANGLTSTCNIATTVNTFGQIDNTASVTSSTTDLNQANNTASVSIGGVPFPADVAITLSSDAPGGSLGVGSQFSYTVVGTNNGPGTATDLLFALQLSGKTSFVDSNCGAVANGNVVSWAVATLANTASTSCVVTVAVVASGDLIATASVSTSSDDPNLVNNSAQLVVGFTATQVPTFGQLGLLLLVLLTVGAAVVAIRR